LKKKVDAHKVQITVESVVVVPSLGHPLQETLHADWTLPKTISKIAAVMMIEDFMILI